jgi:hypothetical protein
MSSHFRLCLLAVAFASFATVAGCVADGPTSRVHIRPPEQQPAMIVPTVVDLAATRYARDSDKNGYADEVSATAFLFAPPHNTPLTIDGEFRFSMVKLDGTPYGTWTFDKTKSAAAVERLLPGPGYRFRLSLLEHGADTFPSEDMQLWCVFKPTEGDPVQSRSPIRVTVGQLR